MDRADSYREAIVQSAAGELGALDHHVADYWRSCGLSEPFPPQWCGAFVLSRLHAAGCALGIEWRIGSGFLLVAPHALHIVSIPQPGDVSYKPAPFQHHAVVERVEARMVHTIDGNQGPPAFIKRASHALGIGHSYFDISSVIPDDATEAA